MVITSVVLVILLGLAIYTDFKMGVIPDTVNAGLICYFFLIQFSGIKWFVNTETATYGLMIGWGIMFLFFLTGAMGYGDVKLTASLGLWFGFEIIDVVLLSFIVGLVFAIYYYIKHKNTKRQIPFAPSIAISALLLYLTDISICATCIQSTIHV